MSDAEKPYDAREGVPEDCLCHETVVGKTCPVHPPEGSEERWFCPECGRRCCETSVKTLMQVEIDCDRVTGIVRISRSPDGRFTLTGIGDGGLTWPKAMGQVAARYREKPVVTSISGCARCGGLHDRLDFYRFANPVDHMTHWGVCPETREPILMQIVGKSDDEG